MEYYENLQALFTFVKKTYKHKEKDNNTEKDVFSIVRSQPLSIYQIKIP